MMDKDVIIYALTEQVKAQKQKLDCLGARLIRLQDDLAKAKDALYNCKMPMNRDDKAEHVKAINDIQIELNETIAQNFVLVIGK